MPYATADLAAGAHPVGALRGGNAITLTCSSIAQSTAEEAFIAARAFPIGRTLVTRVFWPVTEQRRHCQVDEPHHLRGNRRMVCVKKRPKKTLA
jgi:hypothetical protein